MYGLFNAMTMVRKRSGGMYATREGRNRFDRFSEYRAIAFVATSTSDFRRRELGNVSGRAKRPRKTTRKRK